MNPQVVSSAYALALLMAAGKVAIPNSPYMRDGRRIGPGKRGLHSRWAKIFRSRYRPHLGAAERARWGIPAKAVVKSENRRAWEGRPLATRQLARAAKRAAVKAARAAAVYKPRKAAR